MTLNFGVQLLVDLLWVTFVDRIGYRASMILAHALSAAIGTFERLITEHSYDQSRSLFDLLHHEERDGTTLRLDTEADRVTAAEIKALGPYQAILYDMATDSVIRFNG